jgi:hypothetical protein
MSTELIEQCRQVARFVRKQQIRAGTYRRNEANQARAYSANALTAVAKCAFESMV